MRQTIFNLRKTGYRVGQKYISDCQVGQVQFIAEEIVMHKFMSEKKNIQFVTLNTDVKITATTIEFLISRND